MSIATGVIGGIIGALVVLGVTLVSGLLMYAHGEREQQHRDIADYERH